MWRIIGNCAAYLFLIVVLLGIASLGFAVWPYNKVLGIIVWLFAAFGVFMWGYLTYINHKKNVSLSQFAPRKK